MLLYGSETGTLLIATAPGVELRSLGGAVPRAIAHERDNHPHSSVVRSLLTFSLIQAHPPRLAHEAVVFESTDKTLSVNRSGALTLVFSPIRDAAGSPLTPPAPLGGTDVSLDGLEFPSDGLTPTQGIPPVSIDASADDAFTEHPAGRAPGEERQGGEEAGEKEPRVRLTGRLGTNVRDRETGTGTLIGSFPIAVTKADESVHWRNVKVFGDRAAMPRDVGLGRGHVAEFVDYVHAREVRGKDRSTRIGEEVHAVVVTPR